MTFHQLFATSDLFLNANIFDKDAFIDQQDEQVDKSSFGGCLKSDLAKLVIVLFVCSCTT
jgi:hypothetical protein